MATELLEPVVDAGVRLTNFFNGRVLTAEDLRREQEAAGDRHRGLASGVGEGVVRGLEVTIESRAVAAPIVQVTAGLAFTRDGDPVGLPLDVLLRLIPAAAEQDEEAGLFAVCDRPELQVEITNPGFYVLVARPASSPSRDQVAAVDLTAEGIAARCGSRYVEQGAAFSLVSLTLPSSSGDAPLAAALSELAGTIANQVESARQGDPPDPQLPRNLSKLRNGMAHWCAGHDMAGQRIVALAASPTASSGVALSPIDSLRASGLLASCEVPLALLYVTKRQLEWVDMWAVRRAPLPRVAPDPHSLVGEDRSRSDASALVLQFRDHAGSFLIGGSAAADTVAAPDWFLFLPPVGILPVKTSSESGFVPATFFPWLGDAEPWTEVPKDFAEVLFREALRGVPLPLSGNVYPALFRFLGEDGETVDWRSRYLMFAGLVSNSLPFSQTQFLRLGPQW